MNQEPQLRSIHFAIITTLLFLFISIVAITAASHSPAPPPTPTPPPPPILISQGHLPTPLSNQSTSRRSHHRALDTAFSESTILLARALQDVAGAGDELAGLTSSRRVPSVVCHGGGAEEVKAREVLARMVGFNEQALEEISRKLDKVGRLQGMVGEELQAVGVVIGLMEVMMG
ncbi:hypothetical protein BP5796_00138 [Coleophoma crateriformis]|uniref:Uncharacterized protein n=1 Tax=Coleophoma crateriformis TaxID=565419 RepID=A0A3D8T747_9HELO|nr:hypothetical protein BP5796_00138 [Coleophoma crateriformis]